MNAKVQRVFVAVLLAVIVAAVYLPVRQCGFVIIADSEHPTNAGISSGLSWASVQWAFTHRVAGNWYPLTMISHAMDRQLYGTNPGGHHLTNLVLHMANTVLLFFLLLRMLPKPRWFKSNLWPSAIIAALFGLHPLRVESVAWVAERKDVLSGLFFMLTLLAYVRFVKGREEEPISKVQDPEQLQAANISEVNFGGNIETQPQTTSGSTEPTTPPQERDPRAGAWKWYLLTLAMFVLGLMAKPMLVTLPCLMVLIDFWPLNRFANGRMGAVILEKVPFFALSAVFSVITFVTQKKDGLVVDFATLPMKTRLANSIVSYARYLGKTVWPDSLAAYYPFQTWQTSQVVLAALLFVGVSAVAVATVRRKPWVFVGWFWFAGLLFPVIGISQVAMQSMADRFSYLPHIGLFVFVVWSVCELPVQVAKAGLSALCAAALAFAGVSAHQVGYWRDSETLFSHIIAVTPDNDITQYFMGMALLEKHDFDGATYRFGRTLELNPKYSGAYMRLGDILKAQRRYAEAEEKYRQAVAAEPNATICHLKLAKLLAEKRSVDEAILHYRTALKARPEIPQAQYELGQLLNDKHDVAGAIEAFEQAVQVNPNMPDALNDLAWALATQKDDKLRDGPKAVQFAMRAVELTHGTAPNVLDTMAAAYAEAGRFDDAVATLRNAIQIARGSGQMGAASDLESHLKLYQDKHPYRE